VFALELNIELASDSKRLELFGAGDEYLRKLRDHFSVQITARQNKILIRGEKADAEQAGEVIDLMLKHLLEKGRLLSKDVDEIILRSRSGLADEKGGAITVYSRKGVIEPFTKGQLRYIEAMRKNDLTFCSGPAGTGKTYLAVAVAVSMLKRQEVRKIVLARPAVEAGERLGFLPGDLQAKVNPYLRPLFDSLEDMMEFSQMRKFVETDIIEIIPLAFMRGRTLNEATIICDEAQNTSVTQMLMFLTRLGRGSKMIITGDLTQVDLEKGQKSGMVDAMHTLEGIEGVGMVELEQSDIVRHKLVQNIVQAYDKRKRELSDK